MESIFIIILSSFSVCFTLALIDDQILPNNLNAKAL